MERKFIYIFEELIVGIFSKKLQVRVDSNGLYILILLSCYLIVKDFIQFKDIIFK
jgi:hypothetical protein